MKTVGLSVLLFTLVFARLSQAALTIKAASFSVTGPSPYTLKVSEGTEITFDITFENDDTGGTDDVTDLKLFLSDNADLSAATKMVEVADKDAITGITFPATVPVARDAPPIEKGEKAETGAKATITIPSAADCPDFVQLVAQISPGDDTQAIDITGKTDCPTPAPPSESPDTSQADMETTSDPCDDGCHHVCSVMLILAVMILNVIISIA
ncbi:uncharacterized protein [Ptychodera flava]|uniref:uncharacterized protein n=1 Tax=Ptychodera flava TaxID=63121 RepID=UPI00396A6BCA